MKHRISPTTVIACAALFFSLGGSAIAASHYLITSIHQIKPSVRRQLAGRSIAGLEMFTSIPQTLTSTQTTATATVMCAPGQHVLGGGGEGWRMTLQQSTPDGASGWTVTATYDASQPQQAPGQPPPTAVPGDVQAWAVCAR